MKINFPRYSKLGTILSLALAMIHLSLALSLPSDGTFNYWAILARWVFGQCNVWSGGFNDPGVLRPRSGSGNGHLILCRFVPSIALLVAQNEPETIIIHQPADDENDEGDNVESLFAE